MKNKALWKDFFMEIKTSLNRFLSIFLIVALGVAFFAGLRATNPDMIITADSYYDDSNLMDIRVLSNFGITDEDVEAISKLTGVKEVEPTYSTHVVCKNKRNELVIEVMSATNKLNKITVQKGRMPATEQEVLADPFFIESTGLSIGDTIKVSSGNGTNLLDTLKRDEFIIVGIGTTSYYLSFQRGSSDIGTGEVDSFIVALPDAFVPEVYTGVYVSAQGAKELTSYTDSYDMRINDVVESIKGIAVTQSNKRYDDIYQKADSEIKKSEQELKEARIEAEVQSEEARASLQLLPMSEADLQVAIDKLNEALANSEKKFAEAEDKIAAQAMELENLEAPVWYVLDRGSIAAYVEYEQNADRIGAIGEVFPVIFFLVAALISLTTMTRMVEEERTQIGILKALGYSKKSIAMKYILYALLATLGGSVIGSIIGLKVLPLTIITAYQILYRNIPEVITPFNFYYAALAAILAVLCVEIATFLSCYKELMAKPAVLMRPEAPKNGKRVILERIPWIWKRLTFTWKATIRNLLRYKKRFFMTLFGIGGCMALLLVGFGLKDSIFVIYTRQFDEIMLYDASVSIKQEADFEQILEIKTLLNTNDLIQSSLKVNENIVDISFEGIEKSITMIVPEDSTIIRDFIVFRSRVGHTAYKLDESGVILTEQIAKKIGAKVGDYITIKEGNKKALVGVSAICENYMSHYVYMASSLYEELFADKVVYNEFFLMMPGISQEEELQVGNELLELPSTSGIFYISYLRNLLDNVLVSLNIVVWVLIIAAGALAFVVLYNLNNININERRRELATIKVLGFYNNELAAYVYRENIILTIIGAAFGVVFGMILHRFVILTVEIDMVMFGRNIDFSSYIYSILLTFLFSAIVNFAMFFKLKKINMVESLKSVE